MFADRHCIVAILSLLLGCGTHASAKQAPAQGGATGSPAASGAQVASAPVASVAAIVPVAPPAPAVSAAADELTRLQDETLVLQARLKELEARQAVDARLAALKGAATPSLGNVRIVAVEGMGANKIATVRLNDGSEFEVAPGDRVVDDIRVAAIEHGAVLVRLRNGKLARLRVGAGAGDAGPETVSGGAQASSATTGNGVLLAPPLQGRPE